MTKERLKQCQALKREIRQLRERIQELQYTAGSPASPALSGKPIHHGGASTVETEVLRMAALMDLYNEKLSTLLAEQKAIEDAIESLPATERCLMRARYIEGEKWEDVCVEIGYSWQQTHRIHARALKAIGNK